MRDGGSIAGVAFSGDSTYLEFEVGGSIDGVVGDRWAITFDGLANCGGFWSASDAGLVLRRFAGGGAGVENEAIMRMRRLRWWRFKSYKDNSSGIQIPILHRFEDLFLSELEVVLDSRSTMSVWIAFA